MAISKKGCRKIQVSGETFLWKVRKKVSHDERHNDQLGIPIQHASEGQLLIVYLGYCRSEDYGRESVVSITPTMISESIQEAIKLGWNYKEKGKPVALVNNTLTEDTKTSKYKAD